MLPLRDASARTGHADNLDAVGHDVTGDLSAAVSGWQLAGFGDRRAAPG